jgi:hypothetical protein
MLPLSAWPPGPPGASLSPFGLPREIDVGRHRHGFVIPKGAWIVVTGSNRVVMFRPAVEPYNPARTPGTGLLPGSIPINRPRQRRPPRPPRGESVWIGPGEVTFNEAGTAAISMSLAKAAVPPCPPPPCPSPSPPNGPRPFAKFDTVLEAWRAWQRRTGNTDPPLRPLAGRRPPNWFGWRFVNAPGSTLIHPGGSGLVIADGQNVIIAGSGFSTITQAYSV